MWQRHLLRFLFLLLGLEICVASKFGIPRRDMWILFGIGGCAAFAVGVAAIQAYHFSTGRGKPLDEHFATVVENPFLGNTAAHRDPRFRTARSDRAAVEQKARLQEFYSLFPEDIRQYIEPKPKARETQQEKDEKQAKKEPAARGTIAWVIENDATLKAWRDYWEGRR